MLFTDFCTYWIHRWLHIPVIYRAIHKPHHKYMGTFSIRLCTYIVYHDHSYSFLCFPVPTPFASHAFHFLDGYLQSVPFHLAVFIFPLHRVVYLTLFEFVNFWTIFVSSLSTSYLPVLGPCHTAHANAYFPRFTTLT